MPVMSISAWTTSPSRMMSRLSPSVRAACTATSRAISTYAPTATCCLLAFRRSARSGPRTDRQNVKTADEYYDRIDAGALPVFRGIELDGRRHSAPLDHPGPDVSFRPVDRKYRKFAPDRLPQVLRGRTGRHERNGARRPAQGRARTGSPCCRRAGMLVRVISMVFDRYLREGRQRASYSKVI